MNKGKLLTVFILYLLAIAALCLFPKAYYTEFRPFLSYVEDGKTPGVGRVVTGKHATIGSSDADKIVKEKVINYAIFPPDGLFKDYVLIKLQSNRFQLVQAASSYTWRTTGPEALDMPELKKAFLLIDFDQLQPWVNPNFWNHRQGYQRIMIGIFASLVFFYTLIRELKAAKKTATNE